MDNIRGGYIFKTVTDKEHIRGGYFFKTTTDISEISVTVRFLKPPRIYLRYPWRLHNRNRYGYLDIRGGYILQITTDKISKYPWRLYILIRGGLEYSTTTNISKIQKIQKL